MSQCLSREGDKTACQSFLVGVDELDPLLLGDALPVLGLLSPDISVNIVIECGPIICIVTGSPFLSFAWTREELGTTFTSLKPSFCSFCWISCGRFVVVWLEPAPDVVCWLDFAPWARAV